MRTLIALAAIVAIAWAVGFFTPHSARADDKTTISGVLIDQACADGMMKKDDPEKAAEDHTKDCATKEACEKSGYGIIHGKEFIKFDEHGNKLAKDWLAHTDKTDHLRVTVEGTRDGDHMTVDSIKDEQK